MTKRSPSLWWTGLSGCLYLSGFLDACQQGHRAVQADQGRHRENCAELAAGTPDWYADCVALTLTAPKRTLVYVWHRGGKDAEISLRIEPGVRAERLLECYPCHLTTWEVTDACDGSVLLSPGLAGPSARVYQISKEAA